MTSHLGPTEHEVYRAAIEASPCATIVADGAGIIAMVNREAERLFGYDAGALLGQSIEILLPDDLRERHVGQRAGYAEQPVARPMGRQRDLRARHRDGRTFPVEVGLNPVRAAGRSYVVCAVVDLTQRQHAEERIAQQAALLQLANARLAELASTDSLTSLWNRRAFLDQLDIQLEQSVRSARPVSVLILDIDHFKPYNDQHGHLAGDEILRCTARVLRDSARRSDFVARIGGEEFGIILPDADRDGAVKLAERFRAAIEATSWPRRSITISIGAATVAFRSAVPRPEPPECSQVLAAADRALYSSKERGRNRVTHVEDVTAVAGGTRRA
jgi:diguanylate cyclase (GGDEF)-like protein/PAS domain S-box-containing protein